METIKNRICIMVLFLLFICPCLVFANNTDQADKYFLNHQYPSAIDEYLSAADTKNPKAFYQLGMMYYKGLGTTSDSFKALIWFSMAAEHNYDNSQAIVDKLIANVQLDESTQQVAALIKTSQAAFRKEILYRKYQPLVNKNNLTKRVTFDEFDDISDVEIYSDSGIEDSLSMFMTMSSNMPNEEGFVEQDTLTGPDEFSNATAYFLIADYDIAPDGSIRNIIHVKTSGIVESANYGLSLNNLPKPTFNEQQVAFINRSYLGIASYNKLRMRRNYSSFYKSIKRLAATLSASNTAKDQYGYGMTLMNFPWLKQEDDEVEKLLKNAAENGFMLAKYEYGLKLYREQKNIEQAIYWLFEAAKGELSQAQYRVASLLLDSPWTISDEKKALFWLEQAAKQDHITAKLKSAEVKLLTNDDDLQDVEGAMRYLSEIAEQQSENPEYQYLQAIAHAKKKNRELATAVKYIRSAIKSGSGLNWDVTAWQAQLKTWTSGGNVTIQEL
ncbi:tetratricopeptide repeat protein [Colwellia piezophila]|uniref:tetratricopeptide repeat protein n=1 Tax=Colwellia piezophila TaxID=211668 RepID=UPI0003626A68|nr:SEL1-like repeat protein [Colwellia piezophila]